MKYRKLVARILEARHAKMARMGLWQRALEDGIGTIIFKYWAW
jgi:hypothetical protein